MQRLTDQSVYWDRVARQKEFTHPVDLDLLRGHVPESGRILDYGCGYGRVAAQVAERHGGRVIGADAARGMLERARDEHPELELVQIDVAASPFPDGAFDAVLLFSVLNCIPAREQQQALMAGIERLLRPAGVLYISDLALQHDARNVERYRRDLPRFGEYGVFELEEGVVLRHLDPDWITKLTAGLEIVHHQELDVRTMNGNRAAAFQLVGRMKQERGSR